jgi:hypothetical protein
VTKALIFDPPTPIIEHSLRFIVQEWLCFEDEKPIAFREVEAISRDNLPSVNVSIKKHDDDDDDE